MKKSVKIVALLMMLAMLVTSLPILASAGTVPEGDVITIGKGGDYSTIADAITAIGTDMLDGKTLKLVSNVSLSSAQFESTQATAPRITIDGDGHTISLSKGFVFIGVSVTLKNINAVQKATNHPLLYARGNSYVTLENCTTDETFKYAFAVHTNGNCNITVKSGSYTATRKIFVIDGYKNTSKTKNTVNIQGGFFNCSGGNLAAISAYTDLNISGGTFYTETTAPMIVDTKLSSKSETESSAKVSVTGGSFICPIGGNNIFAENTAVKTTVNMTATSAAKVFTIIESATAGAVYTGTYDSTLADFKTIDTVATVANGATVINGVDGMFAKAYLASGNTLLINSEDTLNLIDDPMFNDAIVTLFADTAAAVDFTKGSLTVDKNGFFAPNIKSTMGISTVRSNLTGAKVYWQATGEEAPTGDATCKVRFVVGINGENYKAAGLIFTTDSSRADTNNLIYDPNSEYAESVKIYNTDGYYTSLIASGETVESRALGGVTGMLIINAGEYTAAQLETQLFVRFYLIDANNNVTYTDIKAITVEDAFSGEGELVGEYQLDQGHEMSLYKKVSLEYYNIACEQLVADGYALNQQNIVNKSYFRTYYRSSDKAMCHIYWSNVDKQMRVITATTDKLPINSTSGNNNLCTAKLITMQGGDELGMVIRTNDGRFIIIDGGNANVNNYKEIYDILKANAPDPNNIKIATWYITHAHGDHHGAFKEFCTKYGKGKDTTITIESIMFNQLNNGSYIDKGTNSNDVLTYAAEYYPNTPIYMPQTGQKYTFSKTTIEILYTMSDFLPNKLALMPDGSNANSNTQTMPCIIDIVNDADFDDRLFVMGDMVVYACDLICDRYGSLIQCDIVQVSHHGLCIAEYAGHSYRRDNSTVEIYTLINPTFAFWPGKEDEFERRNTGEVNIHLASIIGGKDKFLKAWEKQHEFEFKAQ